MFEPPPPEDVASDWFASAFDALYPVVYAHRTVAAARPECDFAAEYLRINESDRLLDLCCGNGRHLVHMLKHTRRCSGIDYSAALLKLARENTRGRAALVRADMRKLPFHEAFSVVVNFFTSFGYFMDDEDNEAATRRLARSLRPGGRFLIDFLNPPYVEENLKAETVTERDGFRIHEKRWIDARRKRVNKTTTVEKDGARVSQSSESVRLYQLADLESMLDRVGLELMSVYGNYQGQPLMYDKPRMILIGRKRSPYA